MKILLAIDGSACSEAAAQGVARRPWPVGTEVKVLSVVDEPVVSTSGTWRPPETYAEKLRSAAVGQAHATVEKAAEQLRATQGGALSVSTEVIAGYPKEEIVHAAERWNADLIVVGSHGYRGLKRLWLGSVSHAVASHAGCSVEIVRVKPTGDSPGA